MRTIQTRSLWIALSLSILGSCGDEETEKTYEPPPVFGAIDSSKTCKPGYIGWDFATGGGIEALPKPMKIVSIDCDGKGAPQTEAFAGQGVMKQCDGATSCNFVEGCDKVAVSWKCGSDATTFNREFPSGRGTLSCHVKGDGEGAEDITASAGKACVPKVCPHNTFRNEKLECVTAAKRYPKFFAFGPPTAIPLQRTAANWTTQRLVGNTEYLFASSITVGAMSEIEWQMLATSLPEGRLEFWFADEYVGKEAGLPPVQGFRCTAASSWVSPTTLISGYLPYISTPYPGLRWVATRTIISPACTAKAAGDAAEADAARRASLSVEEFRKKYTRSRLRLHTSFDLEGLNVLPSQLENKIVPTEARGCLPRPPGFFYRAGATPEKSYIDMIAYYQQRELTAYGIKSFSNITKTFEDNLATDPWVGFDELASKRGEVYWDVGYANGRGADFGAMAFESPTRIRVAAKTLKVTTPEIEVPKFGTSQPVIELAVEHKMSGGDNPSNPYAFGGPSVSGVSNLAARRLRAEVYMHPATSAAFDASNAIKIGSIALGNALPTGQMTNGKVSISRKNVRRFFNEWTGIDNFKVFYCIGADGLSTLGTKNLDLPVVMNAGIEYGAGVDPDETDRDGNVIRNGCVAADTVVVIQRDESRSPVAYAASSASFESANESKTGDSSSEGGQGDGAEKSCNGRNCTMTQRSEMGIAGMFGGTIFDATAVTTQSQDEDGSGDLDMDADAEVLGFTVLDMPSGGDGEWADDVDLPNKVITFAISPEWGAIEMAIDKALTGTSVESDAGRYGGRDGLGIAYGYKTVLTGPVPGVVNVGVSAGVGLALNFEIRLAPEEDYPCEAAAGTTDKCYLVLEEAKTQEESLSECAKLGGYLAEARSAKDLSDLQKVLSGKSGKFWTGGQQAYRYVGGNCAENPDSTCAANAELTYRWLSDRTAFASAVGNGAVAIRSESPLSSSGVSFVSGLPGRESSVAYDVGAGKFVLRDPKEVLTGVCEFAPASDTSYLKFAGGVGVGVAAGLGVGFCTPTEDFGVCIEGTINFVSMELKYEVSHETHTIKRADDGKTMSIGGTGQEVPWELKLMAGEIVAKIKLFIFSVSFTILNWDGFKAAEGSLFDTYTPVVERQP